MATTTMESSDSPSFNSHSSNIIDTANLVVHELLLTENRFHNDNDFSFSDNITTTDDINTSSNTEKANNEDESPTSIITTVDNNTNSNTENTNEDEIEFEFPIDEHISPRFPLFDQTLLLDLNHNSNSEIDSKLAPVRLSLRKLLIEARDSGSCSSSDADELDGITPETYCVWNPNESHGKLGKHKKSNSVSIGNSSKRWNVRDLLKRSYSDDSYSTTGNVSPVLLFSSPISPKPKVKDDSGAGNKIPAYKGKNGNIRTPTYYPYRKDTIGVSGNFNGSNKNLYRY